MIKTGGFIDWNGIISYTVYLHEPFRLLISVPLDKNLEVINLKLRYYEELEKNGPEGFENIVMKEHTALTEK